MPKKAKKQHFMILSNPKMNSLHIGCCWGEDGQESVKEEEPQAIFVPCREEDCPMCSKGEGA